MQKFKEKLARAKKNDYLKNVKKLRNSKRNITYFMDIKGLKNSQNIKKVGTDM